MKADMDRAALMNEAVALAKRVLSGEMPANEGCDQIGDINHALDWPQELAALGLLAHDQYDHESIGITAEGCVPEIMEECRVLISRCSGSHHER